VAARTAASNQLGALLEAHWPGAKRIFSRLGSQIALAFLDAYPTPESAARLGEARLAAFCRRHSYRGGRSPAELLQRLRAAPTAPVGLAPEVLTELVGAQVRLLRTLLATIADLDRALGAGLLGQAKAGLLAPLPRIGEVNLAQVVAEVGPILDRAGDVEHASAECGATPRHPSLGQDQGRRLPVGGQYQGPAGPDHLCQQLAAQFTVGSQAVCRRPPTRQAPPPRRPHPGPRLAPGHLGLLAHQHRL
jgi:hypothetical protein